MGAQDVVGLQMLLGGCGSQTPQFAGARRKIDDGGESRGEAITRGSAMREIERCIVIARG